MADPKKDAKKPAPKSAESQMVFVGLILIMLLFVVIPSVRSFFGLSNVGAGPSEIGQKISSVFTSFVEGLSFVSIFVSFVALLGLFYAKMRYKEVSSAYTEHVKNSEELMQRGNSKDNARVFTAPTPGALPGQDIGLPGVNGNSNIQGGQPQQVANPKWLEIEKHMASPNESEWRVAILEADILLYDMLSQMGYDGDTIGDILKQADESSFTTLQDAWKAHRIRNIIAHEGASYSLSRGEAERAIRLFKRVFEEFYFI